MNYKQNEVINTINDLAAYPAIATAPAPRYINGTVTASPQVIPASTSAISNAGKERQARFPHEDHHTSFLRVKASHPDLFATK